MRDAEQAMDQARRDAQEGGRRMGSSRGWIASETVALEQHRPTSSRCASRPGRVVREKIRERSGLGREGLCGTGDAVRASWNSARPTWTGAFCALPMRSSADEVRAIWCAPRSGL